jgi:hypothetical protein
MTAFALTVVIETLVAAIILRRFCWLESTLIQCVTWPIMALLVLWLHHVIIVEIGVGVVEAWLWMLVLPIGWRKAAVVSFAANGVTTAIGLMVY